MEGGDGPAVPPITKVKKEDRRAERQQYSTTLHQAATNGRTQSPHNAPHLDPRSISSNWTTDIELPPSFRALFEQTNALRPDIVEKRHNEFLKSEYDPDVLPVHESDQVKLTRIYIPLQAEAYLNEERRRQTHQQSGTLHSTR